MREKDQWLTAFSTHDSLYEWTREPFDMKNSGATFVRAIQIILKPINGIVESYVDDMAVHSGDWQTHLRDIKRYLTVIPRLRSNVTSWQMRFRQEFCQMRWSHHRIG